MSADIDVLESQLAPFGDNLGNQNGESRRVCLLPRRPGWLYKEYLRPLPGRQAAQLGRLIKLPGQMTGADMGLVAQHASWPSKRVTNHAGETVGVLLPQAPDTYLHKWNLSKGRTERRTLSIDVLALSPEGQVQRRLPPQQLASRLLVCASFASVGSLFERHGLVYLDWSYANVFWSVADCSAYVIDMDGCSFGPRPQIQQTGWEDPLVPFGAAGNECDRYRIALLTARCLTGERGDRLQVQSTLNNLRMHSDAVEHAVDLLLQALSAQAAADRPSVRRISAALNVAAGLAPAPVSRTGGVKAWNPIASKTSSRPAYTPSAPSAPSAPAQAGSATNGTAQWPTPSPATPAPAASTPGTAQNAGAQPDVTSAPPYFTSRSTPVARQPARPPAKPSSGTATGVLIGVFIAIAIIMLLIIY